MPAIKKYRPSLTEAQLRYIVALAKNVQPMDEVSFSIIQTLDTYLYKISSNAITPSSIVAYPKPSATSLESLGGSTTSNQQVTDGMDKLEYWEYCFQKWSNDPAICTLDEIQCAQEHRYLNDLMSPEEIAAFEKQQFEQYNQ